MKFDNIEEFTSKLKTYTKGRTTYYQYRARTPFFAKTYHVGKYNPEKVPVYYVKTLGKIIEDMIKTIQNKNYISDILSKEEFVILDWIRLIFFMGLAHFSKSEMEKYEDTEFTRYVHGTTAIEGNTYSLRDTDLTLNENQTVGGKSIREFHEVRNYQKLREFMGTRPDHKVSIDLIKKIHQFVLENINDEPAGYFRNSMVGIRGSSFMPTPHILIEEELEELIRDYYDDLEIFHPVESIARFHQRFEEIHPFIDGNGRVGREIMRIQLKSHGYPFLYIGKEHRERYLRALDAGNEGNYKDLVSFVVSMIINEFFEHTKYLHDSLKELLESEEFKELITLQDIPLTEESISNFEELVNYLKNLYEASPKRASRVTRI